MKRLIAVLLVMGVIMTVFAETAEEPDSTGIATATTDVVLEMNQNIAVVWFTEGEDSTTSYKLTLPQNLDRNTSSWVAEGNNLYLNWNIVSCSGVQIELMIDGPLVKQVEGQAAGQAAGQADTDTIGWKISFKKNSYVGNTGTPESTDTEISSGYPNSSENLSATAVTKDNTVYGSSGTLSIDEIITENTYGKKVGNYKATLIANVKTI